MTPERRHHLVVALIASLAGIGIGLEIARAGLDPAPSFAFWLGVIGVIALVLVLLAAPAEQSEPVATPARAGWAEFRRELRRSRRGSRPMTIVRLPGPSSPTAAEEEVAGGKARRLHEHLRLVDRTWVDDGSVYILLPESSRTAADSLLSRLRHSEPEIVSEDVRLATFPDDGLTSGALISAVHGATLSEVPTPIRTAVGEDDAEAAAVDASASVGEKIAK
jgi:hypothetical protein